MDAEQNVQISLSLFKKVLFFFNCLGAKGRLLPPDYGFDAILSELREKQHNINLRKAYSRIIYAKDDVQRDLARADYQKLKKLR